MKVLIKVLLSLIVIVFLIGCAASKEAESGALYGDTEWEYDLSEAPAPAEAMDRSSKMLGLTGQEMKHEEPADDSPGVSRKQILNGSVDLLVEDTEDVRKELETLTLDQGGYIEQSYSNYVVLRIPAELFRQVFETIQTLGEVTRIEESAFDVTDFFQDTQARLNTAINTRNRLYRLLEQSTDPEERAKILKEIGRLTEEIENIKQQLEIVEDRVAFSRITVGITPRMEADLSTGEIPFYWMRDLNPLNPLSSQLKARVTLNPGEDWAVFSKEKIFMAENAVGMSIRVSSVVNRPKGDGRFWQKALIHHIQDFYKSAEAKDLLFGQEKLYGVEFVSKDRSPFKYFVGVVVKGRWIHVVEVFTPDAQEDFDILYEALKQGRIR